jgi:hypothetical protein
MLRDLFISFFSHPFVAGVSLANIWEAEAPKPNAALYRRDLSPKPSGAMLEELLGKTWRTDEELTTDEKGVAWVRAFHGEYELTVSVAGGQQQGTVTVAPGSNEIVVELGAKENPIVVRELSVKQLPDSVKVVPVKASWQVPLEEDLPEPDAPAAPAVPVAEPAAPAAPAAPKAD